MSYPSWILVIQKLCVGALNCLFRFFGLSLVPTQNLLLMYQHDYGVGGYEKYKRIQIFHNKRKIDQVWADEDTIKIIATYRRPYWWCNSLRNLPWHKKRLRTVRVFQAAWVPGIRNGDIGYGRAVR